MVLIDFVEAREILDSRGYPTVEARVVLNDGRSEISSVPSGVTKSTYEAIELRDADASRYSGQGVQHAVKNINEIISPRMKKMNPIEQYNIDKVLNELDQTPNKAHLGSNATLAVSQAVARIGAVVNEKPLWSHINDLLLKTRAKNALGEEAELITNQRNPKLPIPIMNIFSGGRHSHSQMPFQEFIVVPIKGLKPEQQVQMGAHIRHNVEKIFLEKGIFFGDSIEGGLTANISDYKLVIETILTSMHNVGLKVREDVAIAIDVAADYIPNFNPAAYV
ncbi:hypothetical protein KC571_03050, partial [candidate division WWE3 bacterium]|nr:hypothetical protein [candidate division WWE3 bacterium]